MTVPNIGSLWYTNVDLPTTMLQPTGPTGPAEPVSPYILKGNIFTVLETPHIPGTPRHVQVLFKEGTVWLSNSWFDTRSRCITNLADGGRNA